MKKICVAAGALALAATSAQAGGIDRGRLGFGILFEQGNYMEFGASHVAPKVKGTYTGLPGPAAVFNGTSTGDMAGDYTTLSFGYKRDVNETLSWAFYLNTPFGADSSYGAGLYTGLDAEWKSQQAALVLKYKVAPSVSVYGGLKAVRSSATIAIPDALIRGGLAQAGAAGNAGAAFLAANAPAGSLAYSADAARDTALGYIVGAAYEKPEIALRVGLTYESGFTHKFDTTESMGAASIAGLGAAFAPSTTNIEIPQSLTLDFQSGVAKDTLVFGSIRWAEWSVWEVNPRGYNALTGGNVTDFDNNVMTYQLGVGRRLNEQLSVFARMGYEKSNGGVASRLSPTDGSKSIGIGGTFTKDKMKVTAGLEYVKVGDAVDGSGTRFAGNKAVGFGLSVGYRF